MKNSTARNMVVRLIEETSRRSIRWAVSDVPLTIKQGTNNYFPLFVETRFKGKRIALYEVKYRHYTDEEEFYWSYTNVIAILDENDRVLWEYDGVEKEMRELFADVRRSITDVDTLLNYFR
ncbi:hypothetical protein ABIA54_001847 [Pseudomonas sp. EB276 TE3739]|nr:hypothetical protein [Pseudomonas koreensis]